MKKWHSIILLPVFFLLAWANARVIAVPAGTDVSTINAKSNHCFKPCVPYTSSELERYAAPGHSSFSFRGLQTTPFSGENTNASLAHASLYASAAMCRRVELFDNNNLSFNYPYHHFW